MVKNYIPRQKDIVYLDFNPTKGHEQTGKRPAIVISSDDFNFFTNIAIVCPISTNNKEFPSHYELLNTQKIYGSVLCEHLRSVDFYARHFEFVEKCNDEDFKNILDLINSFFI